MFVGTFQVLFFFFLSEHSSMTELPLVGLQIWRGAFLLSDFIISERKLIQSKNVLELGSGVGLSSIVAGIYAKEVVCTGKKSSQNNHSN